MNIAELEALRATRALITDSKHFTQNVMARDAESLICEPLADEACSWCVTGAWYRVTGSAKKARIESYNALIQLCGGGEYYITHVNDTLGHEAVLKMLDKAIEAAEDNVLNA